MNVKNISCRLVRVDQLENASRGRKTYLKIEAGAASINVQVPEGVAARIELGHGLASVNVNQTRFPKEGGIYQSPDYEKAENKVDIRIETGVSSIEIHDSYWSNQLIQKMNVKRGKQCLIKGQYINLTSAGQLWLLTAQRKNIFLKPGQYIFQEKSGDWIRNRPRGIYPSKGWSPGADYDPESQENNEIILYGLSSVLALTGLVIMIGKSKGELNGGNA